MQLENSNEVFEVPRPIAPNTLGVAQRSATSIAATGYSTGTRVQVSTRVLPHRIPATSLRRPTLSITENVARRRTPHYGSTLSSRAEGAAANESVPSLSFATLIEVVADGHAKEDSSPSTCRDGRNCYNTTR